MPRDARQEAVRDEFRVYYEDFVRAQLRDGGERPTIRATWEDFIAMKVEMGSLPQSARAWPSPRSLKRKRGRPAKPGAPDSTARNLAHRERLARAGVRRLEVRLANGASEALDALLAASPKGTTASEVVCQALEAAAAARGLR